MAVVRSSKLGDADTEGADDGQRREGVRSARETGDGGLSLGGGVQDERAMANGLVTGRLDIESQCPG